MCVAHRYLGLFFGACSCWAAVVATDPPEVIVQRSVENTNTDWAAAPQYDFTERDVVEQHGKTTTKTYQVLMIEGSPYNELIAISGQPLSAAQKSAEDRKLQQETARRRKESAAARQKRVAEYRKERRQDHALAELVRAFDYKLDGEDTINGRRCFVLEATPKDSYRPPSRQTQVLRGMRGKMWVDMAQYQWVRVHAEVFRPVSFGLLIARVKPGTEFTLEQNPVQGDLWMPIHFSLAVRARVLISSRDYRDDESYWNYRPAVDRKPLEAKPR
jgi:hypothetical protein